MLTKKFTRVSFCAAVAFFTQSVKIPLLYVYVRNRRQILEACQLTHSAKVCRIPLFGHFLHYVQF